MFENMKVRAQTEAKYKSFFMCQSNDFQNYYQIQQNALTSKQIECECKIHRRKMT